MGDDQRAAALAQLEKEQFDLLLLDLKMPDVDGLTILHRARELDPGAAASPYYRSWQHAVGHRGSAGRSPGPSPQTF